MLLVGGYPLFVAELKEDRGVLARVKWWGVDYDDKVVCTPDESLPPRLVEVSGLVLLSTIADDATNEGNPYDPIFEPLDLRLGKFVTNDHPASND